MVKLVIFMGVVGSFLPGGTVVGRGVGVAEGRSGGGCTLPHLEYDYSNLNSGAA